MKTNHKMKKIYLMTIVLLSFFSLTLTGKSADISFANYHNYKEITAYVKGAAKQFPNLVHLYAIGKSYQGREIWALEISNRKNKDPQHKPALYVDGGTHGDEIFGTEVCLFAIDHLVKNYGKDKKITSLLDARTFYIVPVVNPDAANIFVTTAFGNTRKNLRPFDEDGDGKVDEDPPEDINGDGFITMMRQKVDEGGTWIELPETPGMLVRANIEKGEKGVYKLWWEEGIDNDGDEKINEDGAGGIDLNRNYPANWQPGSQETFAGAYPLSEPESRAVVDFCLAHQNIAVALSNHMAGGCLVQPPVGEKDSAMPAGDKAVFEQMAEMYKEVTGDEVYKKGKGPDAYIYGTFADWAYKHLGAYSGIVELRFMPDKYDTEKQKKKDKKKEGQKVLDRVLQKREWLKGWYKFLKEELKGEAFAPWKPFNHPTLGKIEIGGEKNIAFEPPPHLLMELLERFTGAYIALAELTPLVKIKDVEIKPVQVGENSEAGEAGRIAILEIEVKVHNEGPTRSITELMEKTSLPRRPKVSDLIILEPGKNVKILTGKPRARIGSLMAKGKKGDAKSAKWLIQLNGSQGRLKIISLSQKGGRDEKTITLKY